MESVILNGVEIRVGSMVRLINDEDMYIFRGLIIPMFRPVLYGYYIVRGFSSTGAFLLEGINNGEYRFLEHDLINYITEEPGFRASRFIPIPPQTISISDFSEEVQKIGLKIKIRKEVIESLDLKTFSNKI